MLSWAQWLDTTWISMAMHNPRVYSTVDTLHQLGMVIFVGTIVIVSLRLLGLLMARRPVSEVTRQVRWGMMAGLGSLLVTGPLVFVAESERWYTNGPFQLKMAVLLTALLFHFTVFRSVTRRDDSGRWVHACTGAAALVLWFGVGWMGRLITVL